MATELVSARISIDAAGIENKFKPHHSSATYIMSVGNFNRFQQAVLDALRSLGEPVEKK